MTKDEALKLALEALELPSMKTQSMLEQRDAAIAAVKEALAQPEQDLIPKEALFVCGQMGAHVTRVYAQPDHPCIVCGAETGHAENCARGRWGIAKPVQPKPVATVIKSGVNRTWMSEALGQLPDGTYSLYTTPPAQPEQEPVASLWQHGIKEQP